MFNALSADVTRSGSEWIFGHPGVGLSGGEIYAELIIALDSWSRRHV